MQISFTGSEVIQSRFQEGRAFPNSDAMIAVRFTNKGNADLDELKKLLENKRQYANDDLAVFNVTIQNEGEKGIVKKFLLNYKELPVNEENAGIFSFFGQKMKELKAINPTEEMKTVTNHLHAEIDIAMSQLYQINDSKTKNLFKQADNLAKRLG